jgi:hypothetical protein
MSHNGFEYTDAATTLRPRRESIYARERMEQEEWLERYFPTFHVFNKFVQKVGDKKTKVRRGYTPIGTPALQKLSQGIATRYRTGTGTNGDVAPVMQHNVMAESVIQTKVDNVFGTPTTEHDFVRTINAPGFTNFMLPGALQQPRWGEWQIESGPQVGANLFIDGDSEQFMDNPRQVLDRFAQNGSHSLQFYMNNLVSAAVRAAGVNTEVVGAYGDNEILAMSNQNAGGDGYLPPDIFNPASISGAGAGLYKMTAQADGLQRNPTGGAMTGTRRIEGRNVPTRIIGSSIGNGGGVITNSEFKKLSRFRHQNNMSDKKWTLVVDSVEGIAQIQDIPQIKDRIYNPKGVDYNTNNDNKVMSTPDGIEILGCPSIIPMGANNLYTAMFIPEMGKDSCIRAIVNEEPNTREIKIPYEDPLRKNICLRMSCQLGVGVVDPSRIAVFNYGSVRA